MTDTDIPHDADETDESIDEEEEPPLAELAYTTARQILRGEIDECRLRDLTIESPESDGQAWSVYRRMGQVEAEADVFYPQRFKTAQGIARYLTALALADESDWPVFVTDRR
ncbi:hypothetical protein [Halorubrum aethiopicum]|uniref:hypothetical protein n=1 Tax=Halorubrum aethiopicum TaxID=1758255 RepID=UPI00083058C8|nr:hypothetical protein [Halorubrum aethiopicum]